MRPFLTRLALVSLFLMTLLGAGAGAALADPGNGNGAVTSSGPINDNQCYNYPDGSIACIVIKGEEHTTQTPSGNDIFQVNATFTVTLYYDGQAVKQDTQTIHAQFAETQNNVEVHSAFTDTITYNGQTDCTAYRFHVTDGQYQFDSYGPC